jgi:hypothetical protein
MRVEDDFVAELAKIHLMECCLVANCKESALVAAVNMMYGFVTVLDALKSEVVNELQIESKVVCSVATSPREDRSVLVVIGDLRGMIRHADGGFG